MFRVQHTAAQLRKLQHSLRICGTAQSCGTAPKAPAESCSIAHNAAGQLRKLRHCSESCSTAHYTVGQLIKLQRSSKLCGIAQVVATRLVLKARKRKNLFGTYFKFLAKLSIPINKVMVNRKTFFESTEIKGFSLTQHLCQQLVCSEAKFV